MWLMLDFFFHLRWGIIFAYIPHVDQHAFLYDINQCNFKIRSVLLNSSKIKANATSQLVVVGLIPTHDPSWKHVLYFASLLCSVSLH